MVGRHDGLDPAGPVLMIGSHIDTVPDAGKYDGVLGVMLGLAAVPALGGRRLPLGIDVIALSVRRRIMRIPGVPDEHLERYRWRGGGGRGALGYLHVPTEISVYRECSPGVSVQAIDAELLIELQQASRSRGIVFPEAASHQEPV